MEAPGARRGLGKEEMSGRCGLFVTDQREEKRKEKIGERKKDEIGGVGGKREKLGEKKKKLGEKAGKEGGK